MGHQLTPSRWKVPCLSPAPFKRCRVLPQPDPLVWVPEAQSAHARFPRETLALGTRVWGLATLICSGVPLQSPSLPCSQLGSSLLAAGAQGGREGLKCNFSFCF